MARSFSYRLVKSMAGLQSARPGRIELLIVCRCKKFFVLPREKSYEWKISGSSYSTKHDDSETHEDFKPMIKVESYGLSLSDVVQQDVKENPVMIYMKGVPDLPQCGFSSLAVRVLKHYNVPLSARNILEDPDLKSAVKAFSHWPTFPQIFIKGEFVGGSDIILSMHQSGELKDKLKDVTSVASNQE